MMKKPPHLVPGTAVFLTSDRTSAPTALMHSLKHYKVLHEQNAILSVVTAQKPTVPDSERVKMQQINELFMRVTMKFGYMEQPNIPKAMAICRKQGWKFDIMTTSFFLSRRSLKASRQFRHAALAGPFVHPACPHRRRCDGVFPDPDRARSRGRHPSHRLMRMRFHPARTIPHQLPS